MAESSHKYETVAASQTDQALGASGAAKDKIKRLVITVGTAATSTCSIKDGAGSAIPMTVANTPIGVYVVDFGEGIVSASGAWSVTTGAGATAVAIGDFT